jgi:hypothetical protein
LLHFLSTSKQQAQKDYCYPWLEGKKLVNARQSHEQSVDDVLLMCHDRISVGDKEMKMTEHRVNSNMDNEESEENRRINRFLTWLRAHGARCDKIEWPSYATGSQIRGAVALDDINSNEDMVSIPEPLLLTPDVALKDPDIGKVFEDNLENFTDEDMLLILLMHERGKGETSFFYPYLATLPRLPDTLLNWNEEGLSWLQDEGLSLEVFLRESQLTAHYTRLVEEKLKAGWPGLFGEAPDEASDSESKGVDPYSLESFRFAWLTIQARAFGRRLPYSALVPLCDSFNHANVAVTYRLEPASVALKIEGLRQREEDVRLEGQILFPCPDSRSPPRVFHLSPSPDSRSPPRVFHLSPSGSNRYKKGEEVFTSYGRRTNAELLLFYGFALLDNEHESVALSMPGIPSPPSWFQASLSALGTACSVGGRARSMAEDVLRPSHLLSAGATELPSELVAYFRALTACCSMNEKDVVEQKLDYMQNFPCSRHEREAFSTLGAHMSASLAAFPTSIEEDEAELLACLAASKGSEGKRREVDPWEIKGIRDAGVKGENASCRLAALTYRLTRKRIIKHHLELVDKRLAALNATLRMERNQETAFVVTENASERKKKK